MAARRGSRKRRGSSAAEEWIRARVPRLAAIEVVHERPWATVWRVATEQGMLWFKACAPVQSFEPYLTRSLFERWPDRTAKVLACDEQRGWLLMADAGTPMRELGNPAEIWVRVLPQYREIQRGEIDRAEAYLEHGVPDLRLKTLPERYAALMRRDLPVALDEVSRLVDFQARFGELCEELAAYGIPETVQHDDLHYANVYSDGGHLRVLDWGDASIAHPFFSLVVTFRFVEDAAWHPRLRDAYLKPWGHGLNQVCALAERVGRFAHCIAWQRQRDALPEQARREFDRWFAIVLRRALARVDQAAEAANWCE